MRIPTLPTLAAATALAATTLLGTAAGAGAADGDDDGFGDRTTTDDTRGRGVVVQPSRVAPGDDFSVFDGGNCTTKTATASFTPPPDGTRLPNLDLKPLANMVGATGTLPEDTAPGFYKVTVECADGEGPFTGSFTVTKPKRDRDGEPRDTRHDGEPTGQAHHDLTPDKAPDKAPGKLPETKDGEPDTPREGEDEHDAARHHEPRDERQGEERAKEHDAGRDRHGDKDKGKDAGRHGGDADRHHDGEHTPDRDRDHHRDGEHADRHAGDGSEATRHRSHDGPAPKGSVATGVGGSTAADTTAWALGGAATLGLIGGALWYRRRGRA
ncbi:Ig domain-containing protein [Streptomyces sp. JJ38]|uniref:Ig domain-containing protein n=1 Tax=Streptomyces sp. JJ38 TaxID=2738128 RepID=UPI001C57A6A8|nr:Ig domain-containing protein [Streptomyces sp. JJ38]MBW1598734.1 hypothetical protein [Streptomyces sp. JJ38]